MSFAQLHIHNHAGSRLDAIASPMDYVKKAKEYGHPALAVTDHGRLSAIYEHQEACLKHGIKPLLGVEAYLADDLITIGDDGKRKRGKNYHLIILAKNAQGYKNLLKLNYLSMKDTDHFYYVNRISFDELFENGDGLVVGSGCMGSRWGRLIQDNKPEEARELFKRFAERFGEDFYAEVQFNELTDPIGEGASEGQKTINDYMIEFAKEFDVPVVVTGDVHYAEKGQDHLQTISIAIRDKATIDNLSFEIESKNLYYHNEEDYVRFNEEFGYGYPKEQIFEWYHNAGKIADKIDFVIPERSRVYLPKVSIDDDADLIRKAKEGLSKKFEGKIPPEYSKRLAYELEVIIRKGFASYMLILEDVFRFVEENGYYRGPARGSAAGSLVLYALGITTLDPLRYGLMFERFMSNDRSVDVVCNYFDKG